MAEDRIQKAIKDRLTRYPVMNRSMLTTSLSPLPRDTINANLVELIEAGIVMRSTIRKGDSYTTVYYLLRHEEIVKSLLEVEGYTIWQEGS